MIITSIKPASEMYNVREFPLMLHSITAKHYQRLFNSMPFIIWTKNSFLVTISATFVSIVIGCLAGYSIARLRFPGATTIGIGIFMTYLIPRTLLFLPLAHILKRWGIGDSLVSLIVTYPTFLIPFCTWILMGYFASIPREIEECAMVDGCTRMQAFIKVVLPLATPGFISVSIFCFTLSWTEFLYPLSFIQSELQKPLTVGIVSRLRCGDAFFWGSIMAGGTLTSLPVIILYSFLQRHFVSGLTAGAVKY